MHAPGRRYSRKTGDRAPSGLLLGCGSRRNSSDSREKVFPGHTAPWLVCHRIRFCSADGPVLRCGHCLGTAASPALHWVPSTGAAQPALPGLPLWDPGLFAGPCLPTG